MAQRTVTLQEVAQASGVHPGTVSRALNPATRRLVNDGTAARIVATAQRLGYRGNPMARGLRTRVSMTIGVLVPDLQNPFYPPIVRGIDDEIGAMNYVPVIANTDNSADKERVVFERLRGRQVDGFVLATARQEDQLIREAAADGVRMVLVSRTVTGLHLPAVVVDEEAAMRQAVEHLHALGHTGIGHVAGPEGISPGVVRAAGFAAACHDLGIACAPMVRGDGLTVDAGQAACRRLLDEHPVTAIVAANDLMALGCLAAFGERGIRCPSDISLIGVNDMTFLDRIDPPLTSVSTPKYQMGRSAAQLLLSMINDPDAPAEVRRLFPRLVVRGSTGRPRQTATRRSRPAAGGTR